MFILQASFQYIIKYDFYFRFIKQIMNTGSLRGGDGSVAGGRRATPALHSFS
jgi:hypothetical protein